MKGEAYLLSYELDHSYSCRAVRSGFRVLSRENKRVGRFAPYWEWMAGFAALYVLSAVLLAKATETLPIGTAYLIWTGIGAIGSVLVGIFFFHEPATFWRIFFISTLIISIVGLKTLS